MIEKKLQSLNEIIVGTAQPETAKLLSRLKREGRVHRLAPRIYTINLTDSAENIILNIFGMLFDYLFKRTVNLFNALDIFRLCAVSAFNGFNYAFNYFFSWSIKI